MRRLASVTLFVFMILPRTTVAAEFSRAPSMGALENSTTVQDGHPALSVPEETLKVLTYNVQFRPAIADVIHPEWPNTQERAQAIGHAIAQYDIVTLQEVFRTDRLNEIVSTANTAALISGSSSQLPSGRLFDVAIGPAPRRIFSSQASVLQSLVGTVTRTLYNIIDTIREENHQAKPVENSGLVILSRYPIVQQDWITYQHKSGVDAWTNKGALHVAVRRGNVSSTNNILDVFVTHLQAGGTAQRFERRGQVSELARFIRTVHDEHPERSVLIMGDFNINGTLVQQEDKSSSYLFLRSALRSAIPTLTDVWALHHGTQPGFTKHESPKRIDYIFTTEGSQFSSPAIQVNEFRCASTPLTPDPKATDVYLSDHNGVEATLRWLHSS